MASQKSPDVSRHRKGPLYESAALPLAIISGCMFFLTFMSVRRSRELSNAFLSKVYTDVMVEWKISYGDADVSRLMVPDDQCQASYRPLLLVPSSHSGADFFIGSIKTVLQLRKAENVAIYDMSKKDAGNWLSVAEQAVQLETIVNNRPDKQLALIVSNVINVTAEAPTQSPLVVVLMRDPFEILLSKFYQKTYGSSLFAETVPQGETTEEFRDRIAKVISSFEECVKRHQNCTDGLLFSDSPLTLLSGIPVPQDEGLIREWSEKAIPAAQRVVNSTGIVTVDAMDDFDDLVYMFERISPRICKLYQRFIDMFNRPFWTIDSSIVISDETRRLLLGRDAFLRSEQRFYRWVKNRYKGMKRREFHALAQRNIIC